MAVYTQVSFEELSDFLARFDCGEPRAFKGIAEGVENSNFLIETERQGERQRYILTLYEKRVDPGDLPFYISLLDHLHGHGCPVPRMIADREGQQVAELAGRPACLIEFIEGVSLTTPNAAQAAAAGQALAAINRATADFAPQRPNTLGQPDWRPLYEKCAGQIDADFPGLEALIADELDYLDAHWPHDLPQRVIHGDLFPDNVLMLGNDVNGLIDFYFSCTDICALDLAITHAAWCFSPDGTSFDGALSEALISGYRSALPQSAAERNAMSVLARGGTLRFVLTRAYDWINTPADAMVTRKDPSAFARRLQFYRNPQNAKLFI